jgi:hypothetical protein
MPVLDFPGAKHLLNCQQAVTADRDVGIEQFPLGEPFEDCDETGIFGPAFPRPLPMRYLSRLRQPENRATRVGSYRSARLAVLRGFCLHVGGIAVALSHGFTPAASESNFQRCRARSRDRRCCGIVFSSRHTYRVRSSSSPLFRPIRRTSDSVQTSRADNSRRRLWPRIRLRLTRSPP